MRTQGMTMTKMPLTTWALFLTAVLGLLSFPVLVAAVVLLIFDRSFGTSFYLTDIFIAGEALPNTGGSPILYQHLFWFRSEEHTSELQSLMRISYAVFCLKKKNI